MGFRVTVEGLGFNSVEGLRCQVSTRGLIGFRGYSSGFRVTYVRRMIHKQAIISTTPRIMFSHLGTATVHGSPTPSQMSLSGCY